MAYQGVSEAYRAMSANMRQQLDVYYGGLEAIHNPEKRYVKERMEAERQAAIEHEKAQRTSKLLAEAYERKQARNREEHDKRINLAIQATPPECPEAIETPRRKPSTKKQPPVAEQ